MAGSLPLSAVRGLLLLLAALAATRAGEGGGVSPLPGGGSVQGEAMSLFLELAAPYFQAVPPERSLPRLGDRRTRTREGLDELLTPVGFESVSWATVVIDMGGAPEEVWASLTDAFYDLAALDEEQTARLRAEFLAAAPSLLDANGRIPSGMHLNIATSRLLPAPARAARPDPLAELAELAELVPGIGTTPTAASDNGPQTAREQ